MDNISKYLLESVVSRQLLAGNTGEASPNAMHVVFGIDGNYARSMGVAITALLVNNRETEMVFHIFSCSLSGDDRDKLSRLSAESGRRIYVYQINREYFEKWPLSGHYSCAMYYRLIAPLVLKGSVERCLYLDADIICLKEIAGLQDIDLQDNVAAVISDLKEFSEKRSAELGLAKRKYFNSGVMYIDVRKWTQARVSARCAEIIQSSQIHLWWPDQDALNIVLDGKTRFLDHRWNFMFDVGHMKGDIPPDTALLHYTATVKPWHAICRHPTKRYYFEYSALSLWRDEPLENPSSYADMLEYAQILAAERKYVASMAWRGRCALLRLRAYRTGALRRLKRAIEFVRGSDISKLVKKIGRA